MEKLRKNRHSFHWDDNERDMHIRNRFSDFRRPYSLVNLVTNNRRKNGEVFPSVCLVNEPTTSLDNSLSLVTEIPRVEEIVKKSKGSKTIVSVVLVEARGLPIPPEDGSTHTLYCKIRLGDETIKSKAVPNTRLIEWRERIKIQLHKDHVLRISLWDKGKRKNFMGSCVLDLSRLEKERTHEIWQQLDDGYGSIHLSVTMCSVANADVTPTTDQNTTDCLEKYAFYNLHANWKVVGELHVKVIAAKGFSGKPNAYCVLELDNERVQTPTARGIELTWNKSYIFNVFDIASTLDLKVHEDSLVNTIFSDSLGKISIPLLRICNGEARWYALKDKSKKNIAKGNCPRLLLELSVFWNPVKASLRLFQPKEVKHVKKTPKYDIALVYKNLEFVRDTFLLLSTINDMYKQLFEWDSQDLSALSLFVWLIFCYHFQLWTLPLILLMPFIFFWASSKKHQERSFMRNYSSASFTPSDIDQNESDKEQIDKGIIEKIQDMTETTIIITTGVDYLASVGERLYNLVSFKMPFLSFLTMIILFVSSAVLYFVPFNYLMMGLGIYKFARKRLNPDRVPNNDLLDFISRVPDNEDLKEWKELSVPEPLRLTNF